MRIAIATVGAIISLLGIAGLAAPRGMTRALDGFKSSPRQIYGWAAVRVGMGLILILGASSTAFPDLILFVGVVFVFKALLVPFLGLDQVHSPVTSQSRRNVVPLAGEKVTQHT